MEYLLLLVTIAFGVLGNVYVNLSNGFSRKIPTLFAFIFYGLCIYLLTLTVQFMEVGVAYAIWSGAGIGLTAVVGILYFNESKSSSKILSIGLIILGVVLLQGSTLGP